MCSSRNNFTFGLCSDRFISSEILGSYVLWWLYYNFMLPGLVASGNGSIALIVIPTFLYGILSMTQGLD